MKHQKHCCLKSRIQNKEAQYAPAKPLFFENQEGTTQTFLHLEPSARRVEADTSAEETGEDEGRLIQRRGGEQGAAHGSVGVARWKSQAGT